MIKQFWSKTCAFDAEWVPCARSVRRLLDLPHTTTDEDAFLAIWKEVDPCWEPSDDPDHRYKGHPFVKLALSEIVSIVGVVRTKEDDDTIRLHLRSQGIHQRDEGAMIQSVLEGVAKQGYQLWGYNSASSDLPIMIQRALALGIRLPQFAKRPEKPWEGKDYFDSRNSQAHIDLLQVAQSRYGAATPKLAELAAACGIPGKIEIKRTHIQGENVAQLYLEGDIESIVAYNEVDAITNHLLMLRVAHFGAFLSSEQYEKELAATRDLLATEIDNGKEHLATYLNRWQALEVEQSA